MAVLSQLAVLVFIFMTTQSCTNVAFRSQKNQASNNCQGANCPAGTYSWFEGGWAMCSKACAGGLQSRTVECRRNSDSVAVSDDLCPTPKPAASQSCNIQSCASEYNWNIGPWGACSKTCGSGVRERTVTCQKKDGATASDSNCPTPKPTTQEVCNTNPCENYTYSWKVTSGACSVPCGGGTATDTVVCLRSDNSTVADSFCSTAGAKPPTSRTCNTQACPAQYTYDWVPGAWSTCSKDCGDGVQTRSVACRRNDGVFVAENSCPAGVKPATQMACKLKDCSVGRKVSQTETVTPALNAVDVILIIDDSSSMKEDQSKLASRMGNLISGLDALNIDYQVCLTTTDAGYYKGAPIQWQGLGSVIMNKNSPNKASVFVNTINSLGAEWSSDEQGIKSTYFMIRDFSASGCIRNQGTLSTIVVSDEDERSVGGDANLSSVQYQALDAENYPDSLISLVSSRYANAKRFIWNSIIVRPGDAACEAFQDAQSSPSFYGVRYSELSNKTGGYIGSICDSDYSQNLQIIKDRTVNSMPGLTMQCTPIDTPVVTFDRAVSTSITITGNQVKFSPALSEGVKVTVNYTCLN